MRILSSELLKMVEASNGNSKDSKSLAKLMSMLESGKDASLMLFGELKLSANDKVKLTLAGIGQLDIPLSEGVQAGPVSVKASLVEGELKLQLMPQGDLKVPSNDPLEVGKSAPKAVRVLDQLNLPKGEHFVEAVNLLDKYKIEPSADKIKLLAEGSFLALKLNEMTDETIEQMASTLSDKLIDANSDEKISFKKMAIELLHMDNDSKRPNTSLDAKSAPVQQLLKQNVPEHAETKEVGFSIQKEEVSETSKLKNGPNADFGNSLRSILKSFDPKQLISMIASGDYSIENFDVHKKTFTTQEVGQKRHEILMGLRDLLNSNQVDQASKNQLIQWSSNLEDPFSNSEIEQLATILESTSHPRAVEVKEALNIVLKSTEQLTKLPEFVAAMHIPMQVGESDQQLEIYYKKKAARSKDEPFRMLIALNTQYFDTVKVFITDEPSGLKLNFKLNDQEALAVFEQEKDSLLSWLDQLVAKPVRIQFECIESEIPVLEALQFLSNDLQQQFDARV